VLYILQNIITFLVQLGYLAKTSRGIKKMNINSKRLWEHILTLGQIGKNEHDGVTRLSFTEAEIEAKELLKNWMKEAHLTVREDEIGNLYGRKEGKNPNAPVVLIGSHIDSVFNGGIFDGTAGVLAGIEVVHTLNEKGMDTDCPIEIVAFTDEEGARFSTGMLGSRALIGELTEKELLESKDQDGISIAEAMIRAGYDYKNVGRAKRDPSSIKCYLELHIEQGKVLEYEDLPVGLVTGIAGVLWLKVTLEGEAGHAGTTPMNLRKDPLAAAAHIFSYAEQVARKERHTVITVGQLQVHPGGINIIPGTVEFTLDIRDIKDENVDAVEKQIREYIHSICDERGLKYKIEILHRLSAALCSQEIIEVMKETVHELGIQPFQLISGAGHDAMIMAKITKMGMLFVRSKDGISHNPKEWTDKEDLATGAEVLYRVVQKLASKS
jgi:allantoate deiminase